MNMPLRWLIALMSALGLYATVQMLYWLWRPTEVPIAIAEPVAQSMPTALDDDIRRCDTICGGAILEIKTNNGSFECTCISP